MKNSVTGKNLRVLLADDDIDDRELFMEAMIEVDSSIVVTVVEDGEALMKELHSADKKPDLIFLDLNMPRKNGNECLAEIKFHQKLKKIPVVIYSTSISHKDVDTLWSRGAMFFVRKPDSFESLKEIFKKIFEYDFHLVSTEKILLNLQ